MLFNDSFYNSYDEDMQAFYESDAFKFQHEATNRKIAVLRSTLSQEQVVLLNEMLNSLSNEHSMIAENAYACGLSKNKIQEIEYEK